MHPQTVRAALSFLACSTLFNLTTTFFNLPAAQAQTTQTQTTQAQKAHTQKAQAKAAPAEAPVEWCKIVSRSTSSPRLIQGSDNQWNLVYELITTNYSSSDLNLEKLSVFSGADRKSPLKEFSPEDLKKIILCVAKPNQRLTIKPGESAILWMNLEFSKKPQGLKKLTHLFSIKEQEASENKSRDEKNAVPDKEKAGQDKEKSEEPVINTVSVKVDEREPVVIGSPLKGKNWLAMGGYCGFLGHRRALMPIGNKLVLSQRYAIDWIKFDKNWNDWKGSFKNPQNSVCYGEPILAVEDGTVVGVIEKFEDQPTFVEGKDLDYPGGNCITLDIGNGHYAFYAHIKPGGIKVKRGEKVKKGQIIGLVGNSGHSFEPHLHFHITDKPEILKGDGIPYVIDGFSLLGTAEKLKRYDTNKPRTLPAPVKLLKEPERRTNQIPREGAIVNFIDQKN